MKKRLLSVVLCVSMLATMLVGCGGTADETTEEATTEATTEAATEEGTEEVASTSSPVEGMKVAYILNLSSSDIFQLCADGCVETAEALGMTCDVYFSEGNDATWQDYISTCAASGYDGVFVSHGGQDYSYEFLSGILEEYPDFKIVTFDTQFLDSNGDVQTIDGVTQFFQDDAGFATSLLDYVCEEVAAEKVEAGEAVNILKVWVGPNYLSPFDRREVGYAEYEESGIINTVEVIGPTDYANAESSMTDVMTATLAKYDEDEIDAIWVTYDAYARGCYTAVMESGKDIPIVSVDICNTDIQYMMEEGSVWEACSCTDFAANGEQGIRLLALELADEYESIVDPTTGEVTSWWEMPVALISQDMLVEGTTLENLNDVAPETYGDPANLTTSDWLVEAIGY